MQILDFKFSLFTADFNFFVTQFKFSRSASARVSIAITERESLTPTPL